MQVDKTYEEEPEPAIQFHPAVEFQNAIGAEYKPEPLQIDPAR